MVFEWMIFLKIFWKRDYHLKIIYLHYFYYIMISNFMGIHSQVRENCVFKNSETRNSLKRGNVVAERGVVWKIEHEKNCTKFFNEKICEVLRNEKIKNISKFGKRNKTNVHFFSNIFWNDKLVKIWAKFGFKKMVRTLICFLVLKKKFPNGMLTCRCCNVYTERGSRISIHPWSFRYHKDIVLS